jgi:predicted RNase H-like HicB family nuclease
MKGSSIRYAIALEPGTDRTAWGVAVPDLPGCFSAGDTLDDALDNGQKAVEAWIDAAIEDGGAIPPPRPIEERYSDPEFAGWTWGNVEIDPMRLDTAVECVNVTLPRRVLARLDAIANAHGESRSGTIARLALQADA